MTNAVAQRAGGGRGASPGAPAKAAKAAKTARTVAPAKKPETAGTAAKTGASGAGRRARAAAPAMPAVGAWKSALPGIEQRRRIKLDVLVREAAHAFGRAGFHGTSLDDIARSLGLTKAALYYYVKDKRDLLYRCHELAMDASLAGLELSARTGRNGREKTVLALRHYLTWLIGDHGSSVVLLEEGAMRPADRERIVRRRDEFERRLRLLVEEGIADGSVVPCSPKLVIFAAMGMVNWVQKWFEPRRTWTGAQVAVAITEMLDRALSSSPAAALTTDPRRLPP